MIYLITQILVLLVLAVLIGTLFGWLLWGRGRVDLTAEEWNDHQLELKRLRRELKNRPDAEAVDELKADLDEQRKTAFAQAKRIRELEAMTEALGPEGEDAAAKAANASAELIALRSRVAELEALQAEVVDLRESRDLAISRLQEVRALTELDDEGSGARLA